VLRQCSNTEGHAAKVAAALYLNGALHSRSTATHGHYYTVHAAAAREAMCTQ
jgi:hypothetical protein